MLSSFIYGANKEAIIYQLAFWATTAPLILAPAEGLVWAVDTLLLCSIKTYIHFIIIFLPFFGGGGRFLFVFIYFGGDYFMLNILKFDFPKINTGKSLEGTVEIFIA